MPRSNIPLQLTPDSSQIQGFGYDSFSKRLHVAFKSNHERKTYEYIGVGQEYADGLAAAKSKGAYVDKMIKPLFEFDVMQDDPKPADSEGGETV